jgi:hypothetical protein
MILREIEGGKSGDVKRLWIDATAEPFRKVLTDKRIAEARFRQQRSLQPANEIDPPVLTPELTVGDDGRSEPFTCVLRLVCK